MPSASAASSIAAIAARSCAAARCGEQLGRLVLAGALGALDAGPGADRLEARDRLQAAARAAGAGRAVGPHGHVPELAREAAGAAVQLAVDDDAGADADLAGDVDERLQVARDAVPELGQRRQVRLVADRRRRRPGRPSRASISAPIAICVQPRFGARSSVRRPTSTRPGTATPTPTTRSSSVWARANASRASAARSSSTFSGGSSPSIRVRRVSKRTAPVRSSMPAVSPSTAISRPSATVVPVMTIGVAGRPTAGTPARVGALAHEPELVELGHEARDGALVEAGVGRDAGARDRAGRGDVPQHDAEVAPAHDGRVDARGHGCPDTAPSSAGRRTISSAAGDACIAAQELARSSQPPVQATRTN